MTQDNQSLNILGTSGRRKSRINTDPGLIKRINERVYPEEKKPVPDKSNKNEDLSGKLSVDETGKPQIELIVLEKTVVHTPTQEEYDVLMQVYEGGGWEWNGGDMPTDGNPWDWYTVGTYVEVDKCISYDSKSIYKEERYNIISPQKFYETQGITSDTLTEINNWFETNKPNRGSKG
jgi:hypothetical protein